MKIRLFLISFLIFSFSLIMAAGVKTFNFDGSKWLASSNLPSISVGNPQLLKEDPASPACDPPATPMIYVSIKYMKLHAHIDMPGKWMFDGVQITTIASHTPIKLTFTTSGDLTNGNLTIPTYYQKYDGGNPNYVPSQPLHAAVWKRASQNWPTGMNGSFTVRGIGNYSFKLWMGLDVTEYIPKGTYSAWLQFTITQVP